MIKTNKTNKTNKTKKANKVSKTNKASKANNTNRVSIMSSIKTKIVLLIILVIVATSGFNMLFSIPAIKSSITTLTQSYMNDMAELLGSKIEDQILFRGANLAFKEQVLTKIAQDIKISNMDSSYAYIVAADGTMLYHPSADKIGQPVENAAVKQLLAEIEKGNRPETDIITYDDMGVTKCASFFIGTKLDYIVVVSADESEVLVSLNQVIYRVINGAIMPLLICSILGLIIASIIVKPILSTAKVLNKFATLDFTDKDNIQASLDKRKDETGVMGRALGVLRIEMSNIIKIIKKQGIELHEASEAVESSALETTQSMEQVERAINDIAESASSQASETQTATENIVIMGNMIQETNQEVENLKNNARSMLDSGNKAIAILSELNVINQKTRGAIQSIYEQTNTTNESAMKIKAATDIITNIAEETNLLSLNASIEAARAGDQGRGFAVVAAQIQKLAEQSNESARQIASIISLLISDAQKSVETMEDVKVVIEQQNTNVAKTEKAFSDVKEGIDSSIESVQHIVEKTEQLDKARVVVIDVVQNLSAIAEENAASTEETSASSVEVTAIIGTISDNAKRLNQIANELKDSVQRFTTE